MALLEIMEPDEILAEKADQLDERGRKLLAELKQDLVAGRELLEDYGRRFREADEADLKSAGRPHKPSQRPHSRRMGSWLVAAAALVALGALVPTLLEWDDPIRTRGGSLDLKEIQPINRELVAVLIRRAEFLFEAGDAENEKAYYREAIDDLMQAYELDPKNQQVLSLLARIHERLGENRKAMRFLEEHQRAGAEQSEESGP